MMTQDGNTLFQLEIDIFFAILSVTFREMRTSVCTQCCNCSRRGRYLFFGVTAQKLQGIPIF